MRRERGRGHAGETLAEVLVTTTLLGIVGVGVIGAIASILISSDSDRQWSRAETVMRSFAARVEQTQYRACASAANPYSSLSFPVPEYSNGAPAFSATVRGVETWDGAGPSVVPPPPSGDAPSVTFVACPLSAADTGLQQLELRVEPLRNPESTSSPRGGPVTFTVYKRDGA